LYAFDDKNGLWNDTEESYYNVIRKNTDKLFFLKQDKQFDPQVLFFNKIQYDYDPYITEEDTKYMNSIYDRLFNIPLGPDFADYFLLNLSRGLAGDLVKCIYVFA